MKHNDPSPTFECALSFSHNNKQIHIHFSCRLGNKRLISSLYEEGRGQTMRGGGCEGEGSRRCDGPYGQGRGKG